MASSSNTGGERHNSMKPLTGLCRVWDWQNVSNSLRIILSEDIWPLVFCRGSKEMQGRRVLTAGEACGTEMLGIVLPVWGSRAFMECGPCLLTWCRSPLCKWKGCFRPGITISRWLFSPPNVKDSSVAINRSGKTDFLSTELGEHILIKGQQWLLKTESKGVCLKKPDVVQCNEMFWKAW